MKKKRNIRFKVSDFLVFFFCLSIATVSVYFFWQDINQIQKKDNELPIGTITFKQRTAQRKMTDRAIWDRIQNTSPVYNGDFLRTSPNAEATISFNDGNSIDLYENTMIQILLENNKLAVSMDSGANVSVSSAANANGLNLVSSDGTKIEVQAGTSLSAEISDSITVQVATGSATLVSTSGETVQAETGSSLQIEKTGTISAMPFAIQEPKTNVRLLKFTQSNPELDFSFRYDTSASAENAYSTVRLETYSNKELTQKISSKNVNISENSALQFPIGTSYWKATPLLADDSVEVQDEKPLTGKVTVFDCPAPNLQTPAENMDFIYRTNLPAINFTWSKNEAAGSYQIEIANNSNMENPTIRRIVNNPTAVISELTEGKWFWRITPQYSSLFEWQGNPVASKVSSFSITYSKELQAPTLSLPAPDEKIVLFPPNTTTDRNVYFSWKNDSSAVAYTVTVSQNINMENPVFNQTVTDNYIRLQLDRNTYNAGTWYWTVNQSDSDGMISEYAAPRSFNLIEQIDAKTQILFPPQNYRIAKELLPQTEFVWKSAILNQDSKVLVSANSDFSNPVVDTDVSKNSLSNLNLESGEWYLKIGNSDPIQFTVLDKLSQPVVSLPAENSSYLVEAETTIPFTWNAVPGASFYKLTVSSEDNSSRTYDLPFISDTHATITVTPPSKQTQYNWTLEAQGMESVTSTRITGQVAHGSFSLRAPQPVRLLSPANNTVIKGLDALNTPISLSWTNTDEYSSATLTLERVLANGELRRLRRIQNPLKTENITRLESGTYRWFVSAQSSGGYTMDSEPLTFTVDPVPALVGPNGLSPANNFLIDLNYLKTNRTINFSWRPVENATEYEFAIYLTGKNGTLGRQIVSTTLPRNQTNYVFRDISVLDNGTFTWQIQALKKASDGFVEQTGQKIERTFRINIPLPGDIQIKDTGAQYGE